MLTKLTLYSSARLTAVIASSNFNFCCSIIFSTSLLISYIYQFSLCYFFLLIPFTIIHVSSFTCGFNVQSLILIFVKTGKRNLFIHLRQCFYSPWGKIKSNNDIIVEIITFLTRTTNNQKKIIKTKIVLGAITKFRPLISKVCSLIRTCSLRYCMIFYCCMERAGLTLESFAVYQISSGVSLFFVLRLFRLARKLDFPVYPKAQDAWCYLW